MNFPNKQISKNTLLSEISIPFWDTVLSEVFLIDRDLLKKEDFLTFWTVEKLSIESDIQLAQTQFLLERTCSLSKNVSITEEELQQNLKNPLYTKNLYILDVRFYRDQPLPSWLLSSFSPTKNLYDIDLEQFFLNIEQKLLQVITICDDGKKSYSAAMYFRELGYHKTKYLQRAT